MKLTITIEAEPVDLAELGGPWRLTFDAPSSPDADPPEELVADDPTFLLENIGEMVSMAFEGAYPDMVDHLR